VHKTNIRILEVIGLAYPAAGAKMALSGATVFPKAAQVLAARVLASSDIIGTGQARELSLATRTSAHS